MLCWYFEEELRRTAGAGTLLTVLIPTPIYLHVEQKGSCKVLPSCLSQHFDYYSEISQRSPLILLFIEILDNCLPSNSEKHKQLEAVRWWCADIPIILQKQAMSALISFSNMINSYEVYWLHPAPSLTIKYISPYRPVITSVLIFIIRQPLSESPQQQGWK